MPAANGRRPPANAPASSACFKRLASAAAPRSPWQLTAVMYDAGRPKSIRPDDQPVAGRIADQVQVAPLAMLGNDRPHVRQVAAASRPRPFSRSDRLCAGRGAKAIDPARGLARARRRLPSSAGLGPAHRPRPRSRRRNRSPRSTCKVAGPRPVGPPARAPRRPQPRRAARPADSWSARPAASADRGVPSSGGRPAR